MSEKFKILIGYDGTQGADAALDDLPRAGLPDAADVFVASVAEMWLPMPLSYGGVETSYVDENLTGEAQARENAAKAAARLREEFPFWTVDFGVGVGSPASVILAKSDEWKPDLIVVGTHSHGALSRFFLGSAAQSLVHNALCSVRVARASENRPSSNGQKTAVRLLVGVDGSDGADAAVDSIISRNWAAGTEVRVVSAMSYLVWSSAKQFDLVEPSKMQETEFYRREEARAKEIAERAVAKLEQAGFSVSSFVKSEDPRKLLIEQAEEWQADCIFVGAQGLSRIERILIGSVSSAVAARARCSVEVVRGES